MDARDAAVPAAAPVSPAVEAAATAETRRLLDTAPRPAPAAPSSDPSLNWRERLWRTSRTVFWNWD